MSYKISLAIVIGLCLCNRFLGYDQYHASSSSVSTSVSTEGNDVFNDLKYPADISYVAVDLKYSKEYGIKLCEVQHGSDSALTGDISLNGNMGVISPAIAHFLAGFSVKKWAIGVHFIPLARSLTDQGWVIKQNASEILNDPEFLSLAQIVPEDKSAITSYSGIVYCSTYLIHKSRDFTTKYPGILFLDAAIQPFWRDKFKMSELFRRNQELRSVKPEWSLYNKGYALNLTQKVLDEIPADMFVIKPRRQFLGEGVIIVDLETLDRTLQWIVSYSPSLVQHPDEAYKFWYKHRDESFIIEKYYASDPVYLNTAVIQNRSISGTIQDAGALAFDPTMRVAVLLVANNGKLSCRCIGGFWKHPPLSLNEEGSLNDKRKAVGQPYYAKMDDQTWKDVKVHLEHSMELLYKEMMSSTVDAILKASSSSGKMTALPNKIMKTNRRRLSSGFVGIKFTVNTDGINQHQPCVAGLSNGGFVVVFNDANNDAITGRIFAADGTGGTQFVIVFSSGGYSEEESYSSSEIYGYPVVTALSGGGFVVVWNSETSGVYYYGQVYSAAGTVVGSQISLSDVGLTSFSVSVAGLSNGNFVMCYVAKTGTIYVVFGQLFTAAGVASGSHFQISTDSTNDAYPSVASLTGGGFVVVWQMETPGNIYGRLFTSSGAAVAAVFQVNIDSNDNSEGHPTVAGLVGGGFVVTWYSLNAPNKIYGQIYTSSGVKVGSQIQINSDSTNDFYPTIAGLANGGFVVTWYDNSSPSKLYGQMYSSSFSADGSEFLISSDTVADSNPSVAALTAGGFVVVWQNNAAPYAIWGQRFYSSQPTSQPSRQPSSQPTGQPSRQPISGPSRQPTSQPSCQPSCQPSRQPSSRPTTQPSLQPNRIPSSHPSTQPSCQPSKQPSSQPSRQPSCQPMGKPSSRPSKQPSNCPSLQPTTQPSSQPSVQPSWQPSDQPTGQPTHQPSSYPSCQPTLQPTSRPSYQPSSRPSTQPSQQPTSQPSKQPNAHPSSQPSCSPSSLPTAQPTNPTSIPSTVPTDQPSLQPIVPPTTQPSDQPTEQPSSRPTSEPISAPTAQPLCQPSGHPSNQPSVRPSAHPSCVPSCQPTTIPSVLPSNQPNQTPSHQPTRQPSSQPTVEPSTQPSCHPSDQPSSQPLRKPTSTPSLQPIEFPTSQPSLTPSRRPSASPSSQPSFYPSIQPSYTPSCQPSDVPSTQPVPQPTSFPSSWPSVEPSTQPSQLPTQQPSSKPSCAPTADPTSQPIDQPSVVPSRQPSCMPSSQPSVQPLIHPTGQPTPIPTITTEFPTTIIPSVVPSVCPSLCPSVVPSPDPSVVPSALPTFTPTVHPSLNPTTSCPTVVPTLVSAAPQLSSFPNAPSRKPSQFPSKCPSVKPTRGPTTSPSRISSNQPSVTPSFTPTVNLSVRPTLQPTAPTVVPSLSIPRISPSPTVLPGMSDFPTEIPVPPTVCPSTELPSEMPTATPSIEPTATPTSSMPSTIHPSTAPSTFEFYASHPKATLPSNQSISVFGSVDATYKIVLPFFSMSNGPFGTVFEDIILSPGDDTYISYVLNGGSALLSPLSVSQGNRYSGAVAFDTSRRSVSVISDINGDGYADLIIGDAYVSRCYVMFGTQFGLIDMTRGFTIFGESEGDLMGWSVSGAGDVNSDTLNDIIIGAPSVNGVGAFYVVYGRKNYNFDLYLNNLTASQGFVVYGAQKSDFLGISVSNAGDVNGDGCDDVIVGSVVVSEYNAGAVYVVYGCSSESTMLTSTAQLTPQQGYRLSGISYGYFGYSVSGAGDVNQDGFDDVLIGSAPQKSSLIPVTYLVYGTNTLPGNELLSSLTSSQSILITGGGMSVSYVGDVNHDGFNDILVGANLETTTKSLAYIFYSNVTLLTKFIFPTMLPLFAPTTSPTLLPSKLPKIKSSVAPSASTNIPTPDVSQPSSWPSSHPSIPTIAPSTHPTEVPTAVSSQPPTEAPSKEPTVEPSEVPSAMPLGAPSTNVPTDLRLTRVPLSFPTQAPFNISAPRQRSDYYVEGAAVIDDQTEGYQNYFVKTNETVSIYNRKGHNKYTVYPFPDSSLTIVYLNRSNDLIDLTGFTSITQFEQLQISEGSVIVALPSDQTIHILNLHPVDMSASNFVFYVDLIVSDDDSKTKKTLSVVGRVLIAIGSLFILIMLLRLNGNFSWFRSIIDPKLPDTFLMEVKYFSDGELVLEERDNIDKADNSARSSQSSLSSFSNGETMLENLSERTLNSDGELVLEQREKKMKYNSDPPSPFSMSSLASGGSELENLSDHTLNSDGEFLKMKVSGTLFKVQYIDSSKSSAWSDFSVDS